MAEWLPLVLIGAQTNGRVRKLIDMMVILNRLRQKIYITATMKLRML